MRKLKKFLTAMLSASMVLSFSAVPAWAEENYDYTLEHIVRYCWMADPDFELTKVKTFDDVADILEANGNSVSLTKEQKQTVVNRIKDDDYLNGYITDSDAEALWTIDEIIDDVLSNDATDKCVSNNDLPF